MRRFSVLLLAPLLVVGFACGDDDDVSASGGGGGGGGVGSFCDKAELLDARFNQLDESLGGDQLPTGETFKEVAEAVSSLAGDAPQEIRADLEKVSEGVTRFAELFEGIDLSDPSSFSDPEVMAKLEESQAELETLGEEVEESSDRIEAYLEDECGLDLGDDDDDSGTSSTTDDTDE